MYKKPTTGRLEERWRCRAFLPPETQQQNMTTLVAYEAGRSAGRQRQAPHKTYHSQFQNYGGS
jgi:hypothetical protein